MKNEKNYIRLDKIRIVLTFTQAVVIFIITVSDIMIGASIFLIVWTREMAFLCAIFTKNTFYALKQSKKNGKEY